MATHNPKPPLRTYSKRVLKDSHEPPLKRQCLEVSKDLEDTPASAAPTTEITTEKKKISDFFKPRSLSSSPSSIVSSVFSSDPTQEREITPPSSPPSRGQTPPQAQPKIRTRRRLTTRPILPPKPKMTDYASAASERRRVRRMAAEIDGGLMKNVDPVIVGPDIFADIVKKDTVDFTKTHTQMAREDAYPKRSFNRKRVKSSDCVDEVGGAVEEEDSSGDPDSEPDATLDESFEHPGAIKIPGTVKPVIAGKTPKKSDVLGGPKKPLGHYVDGKFVQTQLDLGAAHMVECSVCGTNYNKTDRQDIRYHDERHAAFTHGVPIKGLRCYGNSSVQKVFSKIDDIGAEDFIAIIDRYSHHKWRELAMDVLEEHVDIALGCKSMADDYLWMTVPCPQLRVDPDELTYRNLNRLEACNDTIPTVVRFQVLLYVKKGRVISALLVERIAKGRELFLEQIEEDEFGKWPSEVVETTQKLTRVEHEAFLGINKIWTLPRFRRCGIATLMLLTAREHAIQGRLVDPTQIAWTHTTDMGSKLARNYNLDRTEYAWLSYIEEPERFFY